MVGFSDSSLNSVCKADASDYDSGIHPDETVNDAVSLKRYFRKIRSPASRKCLDGCGACKSDGRCVAADHHRWFISGHILLFDTGGLIFLPIEFLIGGLKELCWRGSLLEKIEDWFTPFKASIVVGIFWMVWHWPLFFIEGTYQKALGMVSAEGATFNFSIVFITSLYTFLYHKTNRSVLAVILYHGLGNVLEEALIDTDP